MADEGKLFTVRVEPAPFIPSAAFDPATTNRSTEEMAMRGQVIEWGRARWPGCRVVEELVVMECRIDVAFITPEHIAGVEIKSSKDKLDRLAKQMACFRQYMPEVWVALAPKWVQGYDRAHYDGRCGRLIVSPDACLESLRGDDGKYLAWPVKGYSDETLTTPMLQMLWHAELASIAARHNVHHGKPRQTMYKLMKMLARKLTGDEIVRGVCHELRRRDAQWRADPPCA